MAENHTPDTDTTDLSQTLVAGVNQELGSFVRLELAAEQMLEEEAGLVGAYIKQDVEEARSYLSELANELVLLEARAGQWLLGAADPALLDWTRLNCYLHHGEQMLMSGEICSDERLACTGCGAVTRVRGTVTLAPCAACGAELFQRLGQGH